MFHWLHHLLNPHCTICSENEREKREESLVCNGCEILKMQLAESNKQIDKLVNKITERPLPPVINETPPQLTKPRSIPWQVRRQMLEQEDRVRAASLRNAGKPDSDKIVDVTDLEKELEVASAERAAEATSNT